MKVFQKSLTDKYGIDIIFRKVSSKPDAAEEAKSYCRQVLDVMKQAQATALYANRLYEPWLREQDEEMKCLVEVPCLSPLSCSLFSLFFLFTLLSLLATFLLSSSFDLRLSPHYWPLISSLLCRLTVFAFRLLQAPSSAHVSSCYCFLPSHSPSSRQILAFTG